MNQNSKNHFAMKHKSMSRYFSLIVYPANRLSHSMVSLDLYVMAKILLFHKYGTYFTARFKYIFIIWGIWMKICYIQCGEKIILYLDQLFGKYGWK